MWAIIREVRGSDIGILLGSWWTSPRDDVEGFFSLYRGPNEVIWKVREPTKLLARTSVNYGTELKLVCFRKNVSAVTNSFTEDEKEERILMMIKLNHFVSFKIDLSVVSKNWYQGRRKNDDAMEIKMIPRSKSILRNNTANFFYDNEEETSKLSEILKRIEKITGNQVSIISGKGTKNIEYRNFISMSNPVDMIEKISNDNSLEYFYGNNLYIANMITNRPEKASVLLSHTFEEDDEYVNTVFTYKFNYKDGVKKKPIEVEVMSGGYPDIIPLPGTEIQIFGKGKRVVYLNVQFGEKIGANSIFVAIEKIAIPKRIFYDLMPEKGKEKFFMEMKYDYPDIVYGNIKNYVSTDGKETIRRRVNDELLYKTHDPENMIFKKKAEKKNPVMFESQPYAGNEVGIQYPKNVGGKVVAIAPDSKYSHLTIVGQMYQGNVMPKRDSIDDYRLTLPEAGSDYYSASGMSWVRSAKSSNIMGAGSSISHDIAPYAGNLDSYIECGSLNDDGYISMKASDTHYIIMKLDSTDPVTIIHRGTKEIKIDGNGIVIDNGTVKIEMIGGTVNVS